MLTSVLLIIFLSSFSSSYLLLHLMILPTSASRHLPYMNRPSAKSGAPKATTEIGVDSLTETVRHLRLFPPKSRSFSGTSFNNNAVQSFLVFGFSLVLSILSLSYSSQASAVRRPSCQTCWTQARQPSRRPCRQAAARGDALEILSRT